MNIQPRDCSTLRIKRAPCPECGADLYMSDDGMVFCFNAGHLSDCECYDKEYHCGKCFKDFKIENLYWTVLNIPIGLVFHCVDSMKHANEELENAIMYINDLQIAAYAIKLDKDKLDNVIKAIKMTKELFREYCNQIMNRELPNDYGF